MKMHRFEVIYSFRNRDQQIHRFEFLNPPTEAEFVFRALTELNDDERKDLGKLSVCQLLEVDQFVMKWIREESGKYYFSDNERIEP